MHSQIARVKYFAGLVSLLFFFQVLSPVPVQAEEYQLEGELPTVDENQKPVIHLEDLDSTNSEKSVVDGDEISSIHFLEDSALSPASQDETEVKTEDSVLYEYTDEDPEAAKPSTSGPSLKLQQIQTSVTASTATITWATNISADSRVQYGFTTAYGSTVSDPNFGTSHTITLNNLNSTTLYHFRIISKDTKGNQKISSDFTFTTLGIDITAPVISAINTSNVTNNSVTVNWTTNENATTQVEYGTTTSYGQLSSLNSNLVTKHSQSLSGLQADTTYHYRVISKDASGNVSVSQDFTFVTSTNSTSGTPATIFVNFMGAFVPQWGSWSNILASAWNGTVEAMNQIVSAIQEAFSIFNVNVTMVDPYGYNANYLDDSTNEANARYSYYESNRIQELIVEGDDSNKWYQLGAAGGVSYVNAFSSSSLVNASFIFAPNLANTAKYMWNAGVHELGHAFGLQHQATWSGNTLVAEYSTGANGIAPNMGVAYYQERGLWWNGLSSQCSTCYQDDISILSGRTNNFGLRADEAGQTPDTADAFSSVFGTSFGAIGVITTLQDKDYYQFTTVQDGMVNFTVSVAPYNAMLDAALDIVDEAGNVIVTAATASLGETLNYFLPAGNYYLVVRSQGINYGDLGQYSISGTVPLGTTTTAGARALGGNGLISNSFSLANGLSSIMDLFQYAHGLMNGDPSRSNEFYAFLMNRMATTALDKSEKNPSYFSKLAKKGLNAQSQESPEILKGAPLKESLDAKNFLLQVRQWLLAAQASPQTSEAKNLDNPGEDLGFLGSQKILEKALGQKFIQRQSEINQKDMSQQKPENEEKIIKEIALKLALGEKSLPVQGLDFSQLLGKTGVLLEMLKNTLAKSGKLQPDMPKNPELAVK